MKTYKTGTFPTLGRKLTALAMSALLATATPLSAATAYAEENADTTDDTKTEQAGVSQTAKDEIVYSKADPTGKVSGTYVVNYFNTPEATDVTDTGTYDQVTNLSTTQKLDDEDGTIDLTTLAGEPFYYQGNLPKGTQLPWTVEVTYTLDGKEVKPEDLAGKDGNLDIELKVTGLDDESANADFAKSFVLQAQGTFPDANFDLKEAGDATVSTVGDNTLVTYLQLPGTDGDYHITGKASDFTYSGWQIAAMPLNMAIDVNDFDTSELTDASDKLEDGTTKLARGGHDLEDGLAKLSAGADTAHAGAGTLADGAGQVADGANQLAAGTDRAVAGSSQLASGLDAASAGANKLQQGLNAKDPSTGLTPTQGAQAVAQGVAGLNAQLSNDTIEGKSTIRGAISQIKQGAAGIQQYSAGVYQGAGGDLTQLKNIDPKKVEEELAKMQAAQKALAGQQADVQDKAGALQSAAQGVDTNALTDASNAAKNSADEIGQAGTSLDEVQSNANSALNAANATSDGLASVDQGISSARSSVDSLVASGAITNERAQAIYSGLNNASSATSAARTNAQETANAAKKASDAASGAKGSNAAAANAAQQLNEAAANAAGQVNSLNTLNLKANSLNESVSKLSLTANDVNGSGNAAAQQTRTDAQKLAALQQQLQTYAGNVYALTGEITSGSDTLLKNLNAEQAQLQQLSAGAQAISTGMGEAAGGSAQLAGALSKLDAGSHQLDDGLATAQAGTAQLSAGAGQVAGGANQLESGLSTLSAGTKTAYDGSGKLADGLDELRDSVSGMDQKIIDKLQDTIDEKLGEGYQLHSFVDTSNTNVKEVQFVYVVDGVTEADDDDSKAETTQASDDATKDESFGSRLAALFGKNKSEGSEE